jgi:Tfp pilus assembly protein PilP
MKRRMRGLVLAAAAAALAVPAAVGCGGDETSAAATDESKEPAKKKATPARAAARRGGRDRGRLDTYAQIEERFRLPFSERDFATDPGGDDNRDPFRSFVIRQGNGPRQLKGTSPIQPTDICTEKNSQASGHSVRELRLIGLVLRGTRSYALFRDPGGNGWIVRLRDCLGKEKAVVEKIGAGFVTLEVVPEVSGAAIEVQAERRDIELHPAELRAQEETPAEDERAMPPSSPASQP